MSDTNEFRKALEKVIPEVALKVHQKYAHEFAWAGLIGRIIIRRRMRQEIEQLANAEARKLVGDE